MTVTSEMTDRALGALTEARGFALRIAEARQEQRDFAVRRAQAVAKAIQLGMTKTEVAEELGISLQAITAILKRLPCQPTVARHRRTKGA